MTPMKAATKIRDALVKQYGAANTVDLMLWDAEKCKQMGYGDGEAAIVWEGAPLHDWAVEISMTESVLNLAGVLAEPYNGHILNFYTV
ncbi:hypothetical protein LCGC14_1770900 [marine sediment metagenome]|uniref:Uncharacterized protein n=1 Tax=marine sediment metagenome TaxID=412755 RepID=A0A0F9GYB4_9ZZZZ